MILKGLTMGDFGAVGGVERVRDLGGEVEGLAERKRASSDPRGEGLAFSGGREDCPLSGT